MIKNTKTSRGILIKAEEETNPKYGDIPNERPIERHMKMGIINLDKPLYTAPPNPGLLYQRSIINFMER